MPTLRLLALVTCALGAVALGAAEPPPEEQRPDQPIDGLEQVDRDPWTPSHEDGRIAITVAAGARQTFRGLGAGQKAGWAKAYGALSPERQDELADRLWSDGRHRVMRLWVVLKDFAPSEQERRPERIYPEALLDQLRDARERGVSEIVIGPCGVPSWMRETREFPREGRSPFSSTTLIEARRAEHAELLAEAIAILHHEHGIPAAATGVQNEPNTGNDCYFSAEAMVASVKLLRAALDRRGLQAVAIIAPETASADHVAYQMVDALQADPEAWAALEGIATHSYNMAATERLAQVALAAGKSYWQTEASAPGREEAGDVLRASMMATTLLSDLNHGVTHWMHFIGAAAYDPRDNGTRLIGFDPGRESSDWITVYRKQPALVQLAQAFDPGCVLRKAQSDLDRDMTWTYGRKPRVVLAAGRNPDGSWASGISNHTCNAFPSRTEFQRVNAGREAQAFALTIEVPELATQGSISFALGRSGPETLPVDEPALSMHDGRIELRIAPGEVVTLRSAPLEDPQEP